jgi:hypothetical protein
MLLGGGGGCLLKSFHVNLSPFGSRDSVFSILTGNGLDDRRIGVRVPAELRIWSSPRHAHRPWGPPGLLSNGYWGLFPQG